MLRRVSRRRVDRPRSSPVPVLPLGRLATGLDLGRDRQIGGAAASEPDQVAGVVPEVAPREAEVTEIGVLTDVDEFVGKQWSIPVAMSILRQEDPPADGHPVGIAGEDRGTQDADAPCQVRIEDVVGRELRAFQSTHPTYDTAAIRTEEQS